MNKKELIKNLITDIQDIYSIANRLENPENIHPLDIDLALSKVRNLYELLLKLDSRSTYLTENQGKEISTEIKHVEQKVTEKKIEEEKKDKVAVKEEEHEAVEKKDEPVKEQSIKEPEFIIETPSQKEAEPEAKEEEKQETKKKQNAQSPEIVADKFQSKTFVHDNIAKKNAKKDVSAKMQSKPINDINSAIGLNDKFIFIRELFHNDKEHYHETIQILNNFDTFENAVAFLDENFDWEPDNENYERLKELVRRKYAIK